ncbi:unnamed protein product [Rhizoctonia solani]|uniref:Transmembrane protein n=1 Tax=Rhizoctonia solani TaxID=456999 RepID=A0A8H3GHL9_9AGAM|nr:unnamed protein product [Rhizoctonia solani]
MPSNVTVDDYSPLINYQGQWLDSFNLSSSVDPFVNKYKESSFHSSQTNGSTATFEFRGIAIYIFGAKRGNHGFYSVSVDGDTSQQFDGYAPTQPDGTDGLYQVPLFSRDGMEDTTHTVVLTNIVNGRRPFVDIDYITWTRSTAQADNNKRYDDQAFQYPGTFETWNVLRNQDNYLRGTAHRTTTYGAQAILEFQGSDILLYGGTGPNHGMFKVRVDGQPELTLNGTAPVAHPPSLLYASSNLEAGNHRLEVTNLEEGRVLDIDRAEVVPQKGANRLTKGAIAGIVVGTVAGLALISIIVWIFFIKRRQAKRRYSTDLVGGSDDSQTAVMRTYSNGHNPMVVEPFRDEGNRTDESRVASSYDPNKDRVGKANAPGTYVNRGPGVGSGAPSTEDGTYVERDAGALPPVYDEIEPSRVAEAPVRNGM